MGGSAGCSWSAQSRRGYWACSSRSSFRTILPLRRWLLRMLALNGVVLFAVEVMRKRGEEGSHDDRKLAALSWDGSADGDREVAAHGVTHRTRPSVSTHPQHQIEMNYAAQGSAAVLHRLIGCLRPWL